MIYLKDHFSTSMACLSLPSLVSKMEMRLLLLCMHSAMTCCSTADISLASKISTSAMGKLSSSVPFLHLLSTSSSLLNSVVNLTIPMVKKRIMVKVTSSSILFIGIALLFPYKAR